MAVVGVVKYNGNPNIFAWKYPSEELGTWTQLIVAESQEAVLFKGGQACDVFTAGRHTLETANIPILNGFVKIPFGGQSPFSAEVWYVNKVSSLDIKWGTATPIQLQDPKYGVFLPVRAFGQFGIRVEDSRKFLIKLVGTLPMLDKDTLYNYFRGLFLTKSKDSISSYLINKRISMLEINAYLDELSEFMKGRIQPTMAEYGISLINFFVNDINVPEDDSAVVQLKTALAEKAKMDIQGYTYQQKRSYDTLEGAATNPGSGSAPLMGAGIGLGMGVGLGGAFAAPMAGIAGNLQTQATKRCPKCGYEMNADLRYCSKCGLDTQAGIEAGSDKAEERTAVACSQCGKNFSVKAKFCPECGNPYRPCPRCKADMADDATICAECGYTLPSKCPGCGAALDVENAKFCPECGMSLTKKCPGCGKDLTGSPKYCPDCGAKMI